jgi:hypothetical protein
MSAAAVLSLALAAGAWVTAFRLIEALLLRPLPVADSKRLFVVEFRSVNIDEHRFSRYDGNSCPSFEQMKLAADRQWQSGPGRGRKRSAESGCGDCRDIGRGNICRPYVLDFSVVQQHRNIGMRKLLCPC